MEDSGSAISEGTVFETGDDSSPAEPALLERGTTVSRYMLVERVGLGGMGVVWAAYDPELDRKVALKLLRPRMDRGRSELARTRLIREAQVMAQVTHPNVIAIHDVGEHEGQVFLAMEFVQGKTLRRWVRATRRDCKEIVAMFVQAGQGLAAAHRLGLVHRDFKPANVLIGPDGRARVLDFGLARSVESPFADDEPSMTDSWSVARLRRLDPNPIVTPLTRTGSLVGTPAYMAPEQFEGAPFDARTDQFSFCVALWEALYGRRPFAGATIEELQRSVCGGKIIVSPSDTTVPSVINQALRRGLAVDPAARWPSMDELLAELSREPASGRRRWLIGGGLLASFLAALVVAPMLDDEPIEAVERCPEPRAELVGIWDSERRARLEETLGESEQWDRIAATLDRYATAHAILRHDMCRAGQQAEPSGRCLDDRLRALGLAVELLGSGDAQLLDGADRVLISLPPIEACTRPRYVDAAGFADEPRTPLEVLAPLRRRMLVAAVGVETGRAEQAGAELRSLLREVEGLDDRTLALELLIELARVDLWLGDPEQARLDLEQAVAEAIRSDHDVLAASAATALIDVVGQGLGDVHGGLRWAARARAWNDRVDAPAIDRARLLVAEGELRWILRDAELAASQFDYALALVGVVQVSLDINGLGPAEVRIAARALAGVSAIMLARGDSRGARSLLASLHALRVASLGVEHPDTVAVAIERAVVDVELGDWRAAADKFAEALPRLRSHPATSPEQLAHALLEHARFRLERAELVAANPSEVETLVIEGVDAAGARRVDVERATLTLARLERDRGAFERADQLLASLEDGTELLLERAELQLAWSELERALESFEQAERELGELPRPRLAEALAGKGRTLMLLGRREEAQLELERALKMWEEIRPQGHPRAIVTLEALASLAGPESRYRSRAEAIRASLL